MANGLLGVAKEGGKIFLIGNKADLGIKCNNFYPAILSGRWNEAVRWKVVVKFDQINQKVGGGADLAPGNIYHGGMTYINTESRVLAGGREGLD